MKVRFTASPIMLSFFYLLCSCNHTANVENENTLFKTLNAKQTGLNFTNRVSSADSINILDFNIIYNGGGVAAGDINNDGLVDLYFTVNQNRNKLYLNNGDLTFTDITESAGVGGTADWSTGTTMADINGDGFLDIYTTAVSGFGGLEGTNELFINNGDGTFTEQSKEFGLNIEAYSTHAAFFDFDHDNDLDIYILNVSLKAAHGRMPNAAVRHSLDRKAGDMLLRNDGNTFTDVSQHAGIHQGPTGFGLGIAIADFNNDLWEDIYISNDFFEDDYFYLNNRDGTFTESGKHYFKHMSQASMGNDAADYNNDGFIDIITLDMYPEDEYNEKTTVGEDPMRMKRFKKDLGYFNQVTRNCFQLNNAGKSFSDVAPMVGVEATDWSWAPLLADFNLDGVKDLYITNGIPKRANSLTYVRFFQEAMNSKRSSINLDEFYRASIEQMPDGKLSDYLFEGSKNLLFKNRTKDWGIETAGYSNGAAYADLDNDGDLEIITNRLFDTPVIYKNRTRELKNRNYLKVKLAGNTGNSNGIGAKVFLYENGKKQLLQNQPSRGFLSSVDPTLNFGIYSLSGNIDSVQVIWDHTYSQVATDVEANQTITFDKQNARSGKIFNGNNSPKLFAREEIIAHKHQENDFSDIRREPLIPFMVSQEGPALAVGDVNSDGLEDIFTGGAKLQPAALWLQQKDGNFIKSKQEVFLNHRVYEDVDALFFDANGDGFEDLYVVSGGNEFYGEMEQQLDRLYINNGNGTFYHEDDRLPDMFDNKSSVAAADFDQDGDKDLFVGGRVVGYAYGQIPSSYLLINDGKGFFKDQTDQFSDGLKHTGMVTDAAWTDMNGDGTQDLVIVGEFMPIFIYFNMGGTLKLKEISDTEKETSSSGLWQSLALYDLDRDGDTDILAGNLGMNHKFKKTDGTGRLKLFVSDFEKNGLIDQILTYDRNGKWYPVHKYDELRSNIPTILNGISDHTEYAANPIDKIIDESELSNAVVLRADMLTSVHIENNGDGTFQFNPLPISAQLSPIFDFHVDDYNRDGLPDILAGGNKYGVSMYQGSYNASIGSLLLGDGYGNFESINTELAGIPLDGEIRTIGEIIIDGDSFIITGINNKRLGFFRYLTSNHGPKIDTLYSPVSIRGL